MIGRAILLTAVLVLASAAVSPAAGAAERGAQAATPLDADDGPKTDAVFTIDTGAIETGPDGRICAERVGPQTNRILLEDVRLEDVTIYLSGNGVLNRIDLPRSTVDRMVIYSNGENPTVSALALTGLCIGLDQRDVVLESYRVEAQTLDTSDMTFVAAVEANPPEPGGLTLPPLPEDTEETVGAVEPVVGSGPVDDIPVAGDLTDTPPVGTGLLNETENATGIDTEPVETVTDAVDESTNDSVVGTVTGEIENATNGSGAETVTEEVEESTNESVVETVTGPVSDVTNETESTVDRVTNETTERVDGESTDRDQVGDTADGVTATATPRAQSESGAGSETATPSDTTQNVTPTPTETEAPTDDTEGTVETVAEETTEVVANTTDAVDTVTNETVGSTLRLAATERRRAPRSTVA